LALLGRGGVTEALHLPDDLGLRVPVSRQSFDQGEQTVRLVLVGGRSRNGALNSHRPLPSNRIDVKLEANPLLLGGNAVSEGFQPGGSRGGRRAPRRSQPVLRRAAAMPAMERRSGRWASGSPARCRLRSSTWS